LRNIIYVVAYEVGGDKYYYFNLICFNPSNAEFNPICHFQALLGAHHILHVSRISINSIQKQYAFNFRSPHTTPPHLSSRMSCNRIMPFKLQPFMLPKFKNFAFPALAEHLAM